MKYFDTHAHYDDEVFSTNQAQVLQQCRAAGVEYIVNIGCNKNTSIQSVALANHYSYIYAAIGVHPHEVAYDNAEHIKQIYENSVTDKIVAIGEIGLDYAFVKDNKKEQIKLFCEQIELANTLQLPIVIHSRDAALDTYTTIKENKPQYGALFHCFQPSDDLVRLVLQEGYMVAFGGNITYNRNESFKKYMEQIPLTQMVVETDSPYLAPVPVRGTTNTSANLPYIVSKLAEFKQEEVEVVGQQVFQNAITYFSIDT